MSDTPPPTTRHETLVQEAYELDNAILRAMVLSTTEEWTTLNLTMAQLKTLVVLKSEGSATVGRVAEMLGIGVPTSSHLINRLVQSELAQRLEDPTDRRRTEVSLTPRGEDLLRRLRQGKRSLMHKWMMQMDIADLEALLQGLRALVAVLQEEKP
jgi:DNA-binding MarR family transcriptional regulator